jgi:SEC-C motif-containing protein
MRSRYAAFALGLGEYLVDTLAHEHADHPDHGVPRQKLASQLRKARERQRFMGLSIVHTSADDVTGEVLFVATIFERGQDCSFAELSRFVREQGAWRYADGVLVPRAKLPTDLGALTRDSFLRLAGKTSSLSRSA